MAENFLTYSNEILQKQQGTLLNIADIADDLLRDGIKAFKPKENKITRIKSKLKDIARTNIYSTSFYGFPNSDNQNFEEIKKSELSDINLLIESIAVPGKKINPISTIINGVQRRFPNFYDLDPIKIKFYIDKEYKIYKLFNSWIAEITGRSNSGVTGLKYLDDISCNLKISLLDLKRKENYYCLLTKVWPISISDMNFSASIEDAQTFEVTFSYLENINPDTLNYHDLSSREKLQNFINGIRQPLNTVIGIQNNINNFINRI